MGRLDPEVIEGVRRIGVSQRHRGPDAEGHWTSPPSGPGVGACFAHRRPAIVELSERGIQPMVAREFGFELWATGEIYNYRQLRHDLLEKGTAFESEGDSEVILKAYATWGDACVQKLRGMFAFSIWDASRRRVLLARDRVGVKPLYSAEIETPAGGRALLFASEVRGLLEGGLIQRRLDPAAPAKFLWNGFVPGPETIISGVRSLPAGHTAWVADTGRIIEQKRYWRPPSASETSDQPEALGDALRGAVASRMISDVPLGVFLSGGIDSSAVAALAVESAGSVRTFNVSFDEAGFDESEHARAVAAALGTQHQEIRLTQDRFKAQLEEALGSLDQPTFDGINTYAVSRAVREAGMTVALSGAGGDEIFAGYRSFQDLPRARNWSRRLANVPDLRLRGLAALVARIREPRRAGIPLQTRWGKLGDALATRGDLVDLYQVAYALFTRSFQRRLRLDPEPPGVSHGMATTRACELEELIAREPDLHAISQLELSCFIGDRLLPDTDSTSMAVSLEVRVPLVDHEVIEAAAHLSPSQRYGKLGRKQALRSLALDKLDPALFERPKAGFELPLEHWSRDALMGEIDASFADRERLESIGLDPEGVAELWRAYQARAPGLYWSRIWALFVLLHWTRVHRVTL